MQIKIVFEGMDHSNAIENYAKDKLLKITEMIPGSEWKKPMHMEMGLKANNEHDAHQRVELNLKTPQFNLNTHCVDKDMYKSITNTVDKMVILLKKEKSKIRDKHQKPETDKKRFSDDKYGL